MVQEDIHEWGPNYKVRKRIHRDSCHSFNELIEIARSIEFAKMTKYRKLEQRGENQIKQCFH